MTLVDFQTACMSTAVYPPEDAVAYCALGLAGEAGEVANKVKKVLRDDNGIVTCEANNGVVDELGDVLWYAAALAHELGVSLDAVGERVIRKLASRKAKGTIKGSGDTR